jgi:two-component system, chemotaxis family, CheB/CheR fusion protein
MADQASHVPIVGIGASAGGIEALKEFFGVMPADAGLAFVVIQHLNPNQPSHMATLLAKSTGMEVAQAEDGAAVEANCIYTIPPNKFLLVEGATLRLTEIVKRDGLRMPIDFFFRSLAQDQRENAIAVLFSGSGSDGTLGIREVHGAGGLVIVQDPRAAQFDSMIEHALATGMVDYTLPVREIPGAILRYLQRNHSAESQPDEKATQDGIDSILRLLASQGKNDFRCYKATTIHRRVQRRMGLKQIHELAEYHQLLSEHPEELERLSKDMLIGVTSFFRDPEVFEELRTSAVAPLVQGKNNGAPLRVWVAGCATGEEAYSIVMLFMEEMTRAQKSFKLQVFASDIDPEALKGAREGIYSESIVSDISEERLARFFVKRDGTYQVDKQVREAVTFASHNLLSDPPFLNVELLSCRNLLIYIEPEMQKRILNLFAFALKPGGYLFLGKSETPLEQSEMFEPVAKSARVFRRNRAAGVALPDLMTPRIGMAASSTYNVDKPPPIKLSELNQQVLLKHFNASVVLIDQNGDIRHFYGPTRRYLSHPFGDASLSLFHMVQQRHASQFRLLVEQAGQQNRTVRLKRLEFTTDDAVELVDVTVTPIVERQSGATLFAVIFEGRAAPQKGRSSRGREAQSETVSAGLEAENQSLREQLQAASDGFQVTHEELTAANEEVLAINEELQSTNEELVTSKEELQSLNEELITTNNQLTDKVEELGRTNDDLANFLNTSEVRTLFLDRKLCIRRFTPTATGLMNLLPLDVGRPLSHISNKLIDTDLVAIAAGVLKTLIPAEKETYTVDGQWYLLRCVPYRTADDLIDGVVYTFTDVTRLKRSEQAMLEARSYAENVLNTMREPLVVLDSELKVVSANRAFYEFFQVSPEETEQRLIYELGDRQWDIPALRQLMEEILPTDGTIEDFEVAHEFPGIGIKVMSLNARPVDNHERTDIRFILLGVTDITERRQTEHRQEEFSRELTRQVSLRTSELEEAHRVSLRDLKDRNQLEDQLRQAQKMESLGTLAAGIAHDMNNILNIIHGYSSMLAQGASSDEIGESSAAITKTSERGAALMQQLLAVSRKVEPKLESVQLNPLIQELSKLVKETFPKNIELILELARELPPIMADPNQLTQVLLNLCVNARDAMPAGGRLTIKSCTADGEQLRDGEVPAGPYVCVEVSDTGVGIDESIRERIFEPFFTTKDIQQGTGLGLAVVYGIVKGHNGWIRLQSKPMQGTTFSLYFPLESAEE